MRIKSCLDRVYWKHRAIVSHRNCLDPFIARFVGYWLVLSGKILEILVCLLFGL